MSDNRIGLIGKKHFSVSKRSFLLTAKRGDKKMTLAADIFHLITLTVREITPTAPPSSYVRRKVTKNKYLFI